MAKKALKEVKSHGFGHNSGELSDEQRQALHLNNHVPSYERALQAKKDADAAFKNVCKTIKSEGGSVDDVKLTVRLRTPEGEAALKAELERQLTIARWNGLPFGSQGDFFGPDRRPVGERAFEEGKRSGLSGETLNPPYAPGTDGYDPFVSGWHEGQAVLATGFKKPAEAELLRPESDESGSGPDEFDEATDGGVTGDAE